jgi:hypothetical protein
MLEQYSQLLLRVSSSVSNVLNTPHPLDRFEDKYQQHLTTSCDTCESCSSDSSNDSLYQQQFNQTVENGLRAAGRLDIHNLEQNRQAYELINSALLIAGENAETRIRYLARGEKYFYDYIYFSTKVTEKHSSPAMVSDYDDQCCLIAVKQMANIIVSALEEGELLTASELILRLTDIYFSAVSYMSDIFGVGEAFTLMDAAEELLEMAHNIVTHVEQPNLVWQ